MKRILFSLLAVLFSVASFAQIDFYDDMELWGGQSCSGTYYGAYSTSDDADACSGFYMDSVSKYGLYAHSGYSCMYSWLDDTASSLNYFFFPEIQEYEVGTGGRMKFYYNAYDPNNQGDSVFFALYVGVDGASIDPSSDYPVLSWREKSDGSWKQVYFSLDDLASILSLQSGTEHTFDFAILHVCALPSTSNMSSSLLLIDDFSLRTGDYSILTVDNYGLSGHMDYESCATGNAVTLPECTLTSTDGTVFGCYVTASYQAYWPGEEFTLGADSLIFCYFDEGVTVSFNNNGGTGSMSAKTVCKSYGMLVVPACTFTAPAGMTFKEWNTKSDGTGDSANPGDAAFFDADETLYAVWQSSATATYTISFVANGASGSMTQQTVNAGASYTIPACTFTYTGYTFVNWKDQFGTYYTPGTSINVNNNIVLTAQWQANGGENPSVTTYTVSFVANGGSGNMTPQTVNAGASYTVPACTFTYAGHTFVNWKDLQTNIVYAVGSTLVVNNNVTLVAQWQATQGINDIDNSAVVIYPNPVKNTLTISGVEALRVEVLDITGRVVINQEDVNTIDMSSLNNGVYMVRISSNDGVAVRRIVKK